MDDISAAFALQSSALGHLTSAVQFGFIAGTLVFAILSIADRFSPSKVFFISAILGATFNLATILASNTLTTLLGFRFMTGFFLAGIYPVGMKIAADYFDKGLGKSLGYLVGALVLGTAFPHLLKGLSADLPWKMVLITTSSIAFIGGLAILLFVPDGPDRAASQKIDFRVIFNIFKNKPFRSAAFGYFGHMWELYAFWAFVPVMLTAYASIYDLDSFNVPVLSFLIIGLGGVACVIGGYLSQNFGVKKIANTALLLSGICCLLSPLAFQLTTPSLFVVFLIFWGLVVIADSPLFSTLVAQNASAESKGTALTIVNSIGFSVSIISIQLINLLKGVVNIELLFMVLALGPIFGLVALMRKNES